MTSRLTGFALVLLDIFAAVAVFNLVSFARGVGAGHTVVTPLAAPIGAFILATYLVQGYRARTDMLSVDYASQHVIATIGALVATLLLTYVVFPAGYELQSSRFVIILSFVTLIPLSLGYRRLFYLRNVAAREGRSIVFVGDRQSCDDFREECRKMDVRQRIIYSVVVPDTAAPFGASEDGELRPFSAVLADIQEHRIAVEAIVLRESARELVPEVSRRLVQLYFAGVPTYTLELFHEIYWQKIPLYRLNQTWLFQEGFQIAREPMFERGKRVADLLFAALALVLAFPFIAVAGLAIWLEDHGAVFFVQTRIGKNHLPFRLFKLRTMHTEAAGAPYTLPGDRRITRVGRLLRASRLDELPQLWNVVRGDMSLIGPRAEWDRLVEDYERQIPCYHFRHLVKPGITGWAQVNYPYGANVDDTLRKLEYDLYYIRHFSFRLDATIVLKTIHIMLFGKGR
ncbi:MAG TPA: exopolysaccharide biosynthesis polyprenyl glycosylphosphotransferase [Opitutaceae bacterium]|nr:exopolysaccharide biosynthesis polyprenyl glycosylphosphotransferase [Opitutaceae bacterium]